MNHIRSTRWWFVNVVLTDCCSAPKLPKKSPNSVWMLQRNILKQVSRCFECMLLIVTVKIILAYKSTRVFSLCGIYTSDCLLHTSDKYLSIGTSYSYQDQQLEMIVSCENMSKVNLNVSLSWNPVTRGGKLFLWSKGHEFRVDISIHSAGFLFRRSVEKSKKV